MIGSSRMPVAPASLSAGISGVDLVLGHDGLDREAAVAGELADTVGDFSAGTQRQHGVEVGPRLTLSLTSTLPRASSVPVSSVISWPIAWRLAGSS